jgi:uncharacterized RDD family membrane protein YckC
MSNKTKITEIKESYTQKQRSKDESGNVTFVEKNFTRFKDVPYVDGWARFGHFIIDRIIFYIFTWIFGIALGLLLAITGATDVIRAEYFNLTVTLFTYIFLYPLYYFVFEASMQSSPGKLIMGRVVVNEYGEKPALNQILARSFSRIVPFEPFSCFSTLGWHDTWSDTYVLRKKDLEELRLAVKAQEFGTD